MAKPTRTVLFLASEAKLAESAESAFSIASNRLGLGWSTQTRQFAGLIDPIALEGIAVVVAIDLPGCNLLAANLRLEHISSTPDLDQAVNGLIARLLGGSDAPAIAKPPPPPAPKKIHTVKVSRETAGRRGKGVTVISELPLNEDQLKELATLLKNKCGTGGTAKDGRIEIQGDQRERLLVELEKLGYKVKKSGW